LASPNIYPNGAGGSSGDKFATRSPVYTSGLIYYLHSGTGSDSNAGLEREKPLATLSQAITNTVAGDTIVALSGHSESLAVGLTFAKALLIAGEGTGSSRPKFTCTGAGIDMFNVTAAGVQFRNLYFPAPTADGYRVSSSAAGTVVDGCYFEHGTADTTAQGVYLGSNANHARILNTTFIVTSTTTRPAGAIRVANAIADLTLDTVVIDGGTVGWANPYAVLGSAAVTRLSAVDIDLLRGSDVSLATGTTGIITLRNKTGSSRIVWAA